MIIKILLKNYNFNPLNLDYKKIYNLIKKIHIYKIWNLKIHKNNITFQNIENFKLIFYKDKITINDQYNKILLYLFFTVEESQIIFQPLKVDQTWVTLNSNIKNMFTDLLIYIQKYLYYDDYYFTDVRMEGLITSKN